MSWFSVIFSCNILLSWKSSLLNMTHNIEVHVVHHIPCTFSLSVSFYESIATFSAIESAAPAKITWIAPTPKAYFHEQHLLIFLGAKFGVQISNRSMRNGNVKINLSKDMQSGHASLPTFLYKDNITWLTGAPGGKGWALEPVSLPLSRSRLLCLAFQCGCSKLKNGRLLPFLSCFWQELLVWPHPSLLSSVQHNNVPHSEVKPNSMFCD